MLFILSMDILFLNEACTCLERSSWRNRIGFFQEELELENECTFQISLEWIEIAR